MADGQQQTQDTPLQRTPLYEMHVAAGAKMVPFAGYSMPVQFAQGIIKEHLHTRHSASLFDVSHMGQVELRGADVASALEAVLPVDIQGLPLRQLRYGLLTDEAGGVLDDLMLTRWSDSHCSLVVNADCKVADVAYLRSRLPAQIDISLLPDCALLALQGPAARQALAQLLPAAAELHFMRAMSAQLAGFDCVISCSGYTGEDGFEISVAASDAAALAAQLLALDGVAPAGLGSRDSLRLEAGLCLYGHDLSTVTTPVEAGLSWSISSARRTGGERAGGFPGAAVILPQLINGACRRRVGLAVEGRGPVREGAQLLGLSDEPVGRVTSGGFAPTLDAPVAMGYVLSEQAVPGNRLQAVVRGRPRQVTVMKLPFVKQRYYRG